ncbi:cell division protein ZapA [Runella sp. CRIBMP]|jgi:cell division protein ZapA (FtsZ GTPase activity inhibitor)|uniref:Cell division protein ZapA n=2 Tax=Runella TaxID=105 RepID=A0A369I618_9BACT|nr:MULTISPECIES: cell division protein ZapA [Runella]MCP1383162.1 cell division protein ZapA [Runella salmonicolor]NBB20002.1 cell division protein ZapA [Runella sp. CRIBMP]RDB05251.1 cell division protein ZapA [Runella aurantiaca]
METIKKRRIVRVKIADKSYEVWADSDEDESFMREAAKKVDAQVELRMKKEGDIQKVLAMVCLDSMVARLKGDNDLEVIQSTVFKHLDYLQRHFNPSGQN